MKLTDLDIGQIARILSVDESPFQAKLQEMGCVKDVLVRPIRKAPFGDPVVFELQDYTLSMRKKEAETIQVRPLDPLFCS